MPPCGGVPYSSASRKKPKRLRASSSLMPSDGEDLLLHILAMDADGAGAELEAIHGEVVAIGADGCRIGDEVGHVRLIGRSEGMMRGHPVPLARSYSNMGKSMIQMG